MLLDPWEVRYGTRITNPSETAEISYYLRSITRQKGCAKKFARLLRGLRAGSENHNQWVRDPCLREERSRLAASGANGVLAGLRVCLLVSQSLLFLHLSWLKPAERCPHPPHRSCRSHQDKIVQ